MKILHIIPCLRKGGAERLVIDIVREFHKRNNFEVQLLIFRNEIEFEIDDLKPIIKIVPASIQLSVLRKNVLNVDALNQYINSFEPNIIHSHLFEAEMVSRSCFFPKAKWFTHFHDNMKGFNTSKPSFSKEYLVRLYEKHYLLRRYSVNGGNNFVSISQSTFDYAKKLFKNDSNIVLLPNAIDYNRFNQARFQKNTTFLRLVNVGSFIKLKNQTFLLDVLKVLIEKGVLVDLTLLGDGAEREALQRKVTDLNLHSKVLFEGNVENVESYLLKSSIYVHSSLSEAFGLTLVEAMAAGLPVVCLDGGGNRDLIVQDKNGYIFSEQNPESFAYKVQEIWENQTKWQEMSNFAKDFAKGFDIGAYVDKLALIYKGK
ncbi:MAG: glycosyltransferase [Chitinophagales bacterium]|nr:glycosyltransferase [Chitinophagales bacterium]